MPRYCLTFGNNYFDNGLENGCVEGNMCRVIFADDEQVARRIGLIMEGEEVNAHETLGRLLTVNETKGEISLNSWDPEKMMEEVLQILITQGEEGLQIARGGQGEPIGLTRLVSTVPAVKLE
ncbi:MAG: hypothetical protein AMXMBFR44_0850 [Candidatus Campbellbacteria bacterium]